MLLLRSYRLKALARPVLALAALLACASGAPLLAAGAIGDPGTYLQQTAALKLTDHPRFLRQLAQLNRESARLTPEQRWQLRFLNGWQAMYVGDYATSGPLLNDVAAHAGDRGLADYASALLLSQYGLTRRYGAAYELANRLVARLPQVSDPTARFVMLMNLSQTMGLAGQTDLAIRYAQQAMAAVPVGETPCKPRIVLAEALYHGHRLKASSPELQQAIDSCLAAGQPVFAETGWLTLVSLHEKEGRPREALALLDRIAPGIRVSQYVGSQLSEQVERARIQARLGHADAAREAALAVVAMSKPGAVNDWLKDAYQVLYQVAKQQGDAAASLAYFEHYALQEKGYLDDIGERALAYQGVQQHVLAQKLETEKLSRQNATLRIQQALNEKTAENSRLYLALLTMALLFAGLWLFRLKRSQLHFKRLSRLDGLTAILNRQCFMGEVERSLHQLERQPGMACMLFVDLDHFKAINDNHGHAAGDEVLRHVVAAGQQQLRPMDLFGRLGGEEFGVLLVGCSHEQGMVIAERMRLAVAAVRVTSDGSTLGVSVSVGLAFTGHHGYQLRRLCRVADTALYRAKRAGRNRVVAGI